MSNRRYSLIGLAAFAAACLAQPAPAFAQRYPDFLDAQYREFFAHFVDNRSLTERMLNAAGLESKDYGRGFALIAGISKYPSMSGASGTLAPASEDIRKLSDYLIRVEGFDEIVVLKDADVTEARLSYFLQRYFPRRLKQFPKSRFLFAYSGHGATVNNKGYLLTSDARNLTDEFNGIPMATVRAMFQQVVDSGFHVLALINACYSGDFIKRPFGGERYIPRNPGAHAITAGGTKELTWHDGSIGPGSVFFEKFFAALDGKAGRSGVVTVDDLAAYLRREVQISTDQLQNPLSSDISRDGSLGGFFFFNRRALVDDKILPPWDPGKGTPFGKEDPPPQPAPPPRKEAAKPPPEPTPPPPPSRDEDFQKRTRHAALLAHGYVLVKNREFDRAIAEYDEAIRLDPKSAKALVGRGTAYFEKKDFDRAIADHTAAIRLDPTSPEAFYQRSRVYVRKKDHDRVLADANEALRLDPRYAPAFTSRGLVYYQKRDYDRALHEHDQAIRLDPQLGKAFNNRGLVYLHRKDFQRALADFNEAIRLDAKDVIAITNRGHTYQRMEDFGRAIAEFNVALRIDPKFAFALNYRGATYATMEDFGRAITDYDEALRIDPEFVLALTNRARLYLASGNYPPARADLDRALRLDSESVDALTVRGRLFVETGMYRRAMPDLDKAIRLDSNRSRAYRYRGIAKRNLGDPRGAAQDLARARQLRDDPRQ